MAGGTVSGTLNFTRKKLRDGSVAPLEERERLLWERAYKLQQRINARHNMEWMRGSGMKSWPDEDFDTVVAMLGLDDIDVKETTPTRLSLGESRSVEARAREDAEADAQG